MKKIFLLLMLTVCLFANTIEDAKKLFDNKQYKEALVIFNEHEGSPEAQYYLGKAYLYGLAVKINKEKAFEFATKSAKGNLPAGINLLGVMYQYGDGVEKDEIEALMHYRQAAKLSNTLAMLNMGRMYTNDTVVKKDINKALEWFEKAIEQGNDEGYSAIGDMYYHNHKDDEALKYYLMHYNKGNKVVNHIGINERIAHVYRNKKNYIKAYKYYLIATKLGSYAYTYNLLDMVQQDSTLSNKKEEALNYLLKASDSNLNKTDSLNISQSVLYSYYLYDSFQFDKAIEIASSAYENGDFKMGCELALYYSGDIRSDYLQNPDTNYSKAFSIANKIIENYPNDKNTHNCYTTLSNLYVFGIYVPKDINKSIDLLKKSFENYEYKNDLLASIIADRYLEQLENYRNAEKWYKIAYDLTKNKSYLKKIDAYKENLLKFNEQNSSKNTQRVFPLIDNFSSPKQVSAVLESKNYYFLATDQKSIKIYNKNNFKLIKELRGWVGTGFKGIISSMAFDENRQLLYYTPLNSTTDLSRNNIINLFDIKSGKVIKTLNNTNAVKTTYLSLSNDSKYILAINRGEYFNIIDTTNNNTQSYTRFSPTSHLIKGKIIKKENDYIVYILDSQNILWGYSINQRRQITKENFTNQITFNTVNKATKSAQKAAKKLLIDHNNNFNKLLFKNKKLYLSESNNNSIQLFDMEELRLSKGKEKINFANQKSISTLEIKYKNDDTTLEVYNKKNKKLLTTIYLLWTKPVRYLIIDNKFILVVTNDFSQMLIFNLNGKAIVNLSGFHSLQNKILYYRDGYLFSSGLDKIIHIWDLAKLDSFDTKKDVYDESILKGFANMSKGNPLEMLTETLDPKLLKQQAQQHKLSFTPTENQFKFAIKTIFLKKQLIYPLASLYIKDNDWIIYNKQGLFTSSKNGKDLIKYHLNQGLKKEAKIIKNDQIFEKFYRPDLIKKILAKEKVDNKIDIRAILLDIKPPKVSIVSNTMQDEKNMELTYKVCDNGSGVSNTNIILNGIAASPQSSRGFSIVKKTKDKDKCSIFKNIITLQPGENNITVRSYDKKKIISNKSKSITIKADYKIEKKPNLYFLSLAVSDYENDDYDLKYAVSDVLAVQKKIEQNGKKLFDKIHTYNLHDQNMTKEKLTKTIHTISKQIDTNDVFVMYIAGHGVTKDGIYYFLPYNIPDTKTKSLKKIAISVNNISDKLALISANRSLLLLDTCGSGSIVDKIDDDINTKMFIDKLSHASNRNYIAASSESGVAMEGYKDHGVFTYVVLDAFDKATIIDMDLTVDFLGKVIKKDVPKITKKAFHYEQEPKIHIGQDFPLSSP